MPLEEFNLGKDFTTCKVQRFWAKKIRFCSYFLLDEKKGLTTAPKSMVPELQFSEYLFRLLFLLPSSTWYKELNCRLKNPYLP